MNKNLYLHLEPYDISPESGATIEVIINSEGIVVDAWSLDECIATTHKTYDELDKDVNIESKVLLSVLSFLNISILFFPEFFLDLSASITFSLFAVN